VAAHRIPGNEPDTNDMMPDPQAAGDGSTEHAAGADLLEEDEATKLGDFA
jgi:hypothetical protein